jgi:hypothetical protein
MKKTRVDYGISINAANNVMEKLNSKAKQPCTCKLLRRKGKLNSCPSCRAGAALECILHVIRMETRD